jgi:hypothetical protein
MIRFIIHATGVLKSFHLKCYPDSCEMVPQLEKAKYVLWFHKLRSAVTVERFGWEPPTQMSIYKLYKLFD